tara:strand:- start:2614 stop:2868 length:255 start_codon:yes stop_codon:yes gene_type:complete
MASDRGSVDLVNNPNHYRHGNYETKDYIYAIAESLPGDEAICVSQIIKYTSRYAKKGSPLQDIKKAEYWVKELIEKLEEKGEAE